MRLRVLLLLPLQLCTGTAAALEDCSPYLEQIDTKVGEARARGLDYEFALELRSQVSAMCAFLDGPTLQRMVDSLDQLLPMMADVNALAESGAVAEQAEAAARADGAESNGPAGIDESAEQQIRGAVPEIGRSLGGRLISRPDTMHHFGIWDLDLHQGHARVLYHTRPDRLQFASADWEFVTYAVKVDDQGEIEQQLIDRRQSSGQSALGFRHGFDEVLMHWQAGPDGEGSRLERWSITRPALLSAVPAPTHPWPGSDTLRREPFLSVTTEGNLFYAGTKPGPGDAARRTLAWFVASPGGKVLSDGSLTRAENLGLSWSVETASGSGGLLMVSALDEKGVESRLKTPIQRTVADREIQATVHMEKRLFVVDGPSFWESPALERKLQWSGEMGVPQNLGGAQMLRQSQAQMRLVAEAERAYGANRTVNSLDVGLKRVEMIKPLGVGRYVTLITQTADRKLSPAVHGQYLYVVGQTSVEALVYLEPLAEAAAVKFTALGVSPEDQIYLLANPDGGGRKRIYRVSGNGAVEGFARSDAGQGITLEGLVADDMGVWVFGRGFMEGMIGDRLWVERLEFGTP